MTNAVVRTNLLGFVESAELGGSPFAVDADGRPYVPVGDGGIVLGVEIGDSVFAFDADHVAPGVTLVHPDPSARHALTGFACIGNEVVVRDGLAAGASGRVLGKRGELGRVIAVFDQQVLASLAPDDSVMVRASGQGAELRQPLAVAGVEVLNVEMRVLEALGMLDGDGPKANVNVNVRAMVPSRVVGNGLGRPAHLWDIDLSLTRDNAGAFAAEGIALGDLVAVENLDVRHNIGYRKGWVTVGVVVHGASPLPGHGPGITPILCAPESSVTVQIETLDHHGVTPSILGLPSGDRITPA